MRRPWAALVLLAACAAPPPQSHPLDPADKAGLQEAVRAALDSPFVLSRFTLERGGGGHGVETGRGSARGFRSGVVWVEESWDSGHSRRLLRVGDRAWVHADGCGQNWQH